MIVLFKKFRVPWSKNESRKLRTNEFLKLYISSFLNATLCQALMALIVINVKQKITNAQKQNQAISCWLDVINSVMAYSFWAFRSLMSYFVRAFISATEYWCSFF